MPSEWETARNGWVHFLERVDEARAQLHCSVSSAWFRGHEISKWKLTAPLFRLKDKRDADNLKRCQKQKSEIKQYSTNLLAKTKRLRQAKYDLAEAQGADDKFEKQNCQKEYKIAKRERIETSKLLDARKAILRVIESVHYGERDAFIDFAFRSGNSHQSSWETLAQMQHYRVPTRLLDWTEVLAIAVFFALKLYIEKLDKLWGKAEPADLRSDDRIPFVVPDGLSTPCIWILNPYFLSRRSRGLNELWDPTTDDRMDYFSSFFNHRSWKSKYPVPIYSPWNNPRIAAQQAMFTVQGLDRRPLDDQLGSDNGMLRKIEIEPPEAAVYGVRHLATFLGLNAFHIFRDLDSLGESIKRRFLVPHSTQ